MPEMCIVEIQLLKQKEQLVVFNEIQVNINNISFHNDFNNSIYIQTTQHTYSTPTLSLYLCLSLSLSLIVSLSHYICVCICGNSVCDIDIAYTALPAYNSS